MKYLLRGGLGNRLFILSAAAKFAKHFEQTFVVAPHGLDLSLFERKICKEYKLKVVSERPAAALRRAIETRIPITLSKSLPWKPWRSLVETGLTSHEPLMSLGGVVGYFQSADFAENPDEWAKWLEDTVLSDPGRSIDSPLPKVQGTAVQIRRGDYIKHQNLYGVLPKEYFESALKLIGTDLRDCVVFTDDEDLVRQEFSSWIDSVKFASEIIPRANSLENLYLLSKFENLVISNSSFGWWGGAFVTRYSSSPFSVGLRKHSPCRDNPEGLANRGGIYALLKS